MSVPPRFIRFSILFAAPLLAALGVSCSEDASDGKDHGNVAGAMGDGDGDGPSRATGGHKAIDDIEVPMGGRNGGDGDGDGDMMAMGGFVYMLPEDFTASQKGGFKSGDEIHEDAELNDLIDEEFSEGCGTTIVGIVRDFKRGDQEGGHLDFETYNGRGEKEIVEAELGDDRKPVLTPGDHRFITTEEGFYQWYNSDEEVNRAFLLYLSFEPNGDILTFESTAFFPIDERGFGNQGLSHNYSFTTEVHTEFVYRGGETFAFLGDDDLWVFINGRLAIDLGGLHPALEGSVQLDDIADEFGLEVGKKYPLELFHAERHTEFSNFRVDTNLEFTNCGTIVPEVR